MLSRECEKSNARYNSAWYTELANRYHVCTDPRLSAFAFNLATDAHRVPKISGSDLESLVEALRQNPAVLRGARVLECATTVKRKP